MKNLWGGEEGGQLEIEYWRCRLCGRMIYPEIIDIKNNHRREPAAGYRFNQSTRIDSIKRNLV